MSNNQTGLLGAYIENLNLLKKIISTQSIFNPYVIYPQNYPIFYENKFNGPGLPNTDGGGPLIHERQSGSNLQNNSSQAEVTNNFQEFCADPHILEKLILKNEKGRCLDMDGDISDLNEKIRESQISYGDGQIDPLVNEKLSKKRFRCEEDSCEESFFKRSQLADHQNIHLKRNYSCSKQNCESSFSFIDNLVKHEKMHEQNQYKCATPGCGKSFSVLFNYQVRLINFFLYFRGTSSTIGKTVQTREI
jgi:hypothetical protein